MRLRDLTVYEILKTMVPWTSFHYLKRQADVTVHCLGTDAGYRSTCQCQKDKYISYPRLKNLHFWGLPFTRCYSGRSILFGLLVNCQTQRIWISFFYICVMVPICQGITLFCSVTVLKMIAESFLFAT
ncbi:Neuroblastoma breakpoint family member 11 [Frankliniella fusca]|uniref:Neuroblastoma breakpoint family member 11 n=1 Tax=Frankliniella fusca TaxID=407009 RepID=A0AAE1HH09_9NEOP|nr:Neuroblastoma breakpoint family member 11 [Frankliniella fusca]